MPEEQNPTPDNEFFIGRREVMFQALQNYSAQAKEGQTDAQIREALVKQINAAAASNGRLDEAKQAKVALEWEGIIADLPSDKLNGFLKDAKTLTEKPMPQLPKGIDYGTDLSTLDVSNRRALIALAAKATAAGAKMEDLQGMAALNKQFETAAQTAGIIDYAKGESLTGQLDAQDQAISAEAIEQKKTALKALSEANPQAVKPAAAEKETTGEKAPGDQEKSKHPETPSFMEMLGSILGGIGDLIMMVIGAIVGLFTGGGSSQQADDQKTPKTNNADKDDRTRENAKQRAQENNLAKFLKNNKRGFDATGDGEFDMKDLRKALHANPDADKDGKLSKEEMAAISERVKGAVENHPEIAQIAAQFNSVVQQMASSENSSVKLNMPARNGPANGRG